MTSNFDRLKQFLVIIATIGVIVFNWLAASSYLGGISTGAVSNKYPTNITPADYAFAIWSLIYLGLIAFSIYQALPSNATRFRSVRTIYILNCAAIIFLMLGTLAFINVKLQTTDSLEEFWLAKFPFGLYFGWITVATILNVTIALVSLNFQTTDSLAVTLSAVLILVATILGVVIRFKLVNVFYPLAIAWALTAIAVKQSGQTFIVASAAVGVIVLLIAALSFLVNIKSSKQ
jgi:hypothetical protein